MTIKIYPDRIDFGTYSLRIDDNGLRVTSPSTSIVSGNFSAISGFSQFSPLQGSVAGYNSGGFDTLVFSDVIESFPFATDTNSSDVGNLTVSRQGPAGQSSQEHGYSSGGQIPPYSSSNIIDKFSFASTANATDVGDLSALRYGGHAGHSSQTNGYDAGAFGGSSSVQKFSLVSDGNATAALSLTVSRQQSSGQSSDTHGYTSGGGIPFPTNLNVIDKFPFATDTNASDVGDLTFANYRTSGQSSLTNGYVSGSNLPTPSTNSRAIQKFPFATDTNSSIIGNLTAGTYGRYDSTGQSSFNYGYATGGGFEAIIDKFSFATDADASNIGSLLGNIQNSAGQQD